MERDDDEHSRGTKQQQQASSRRGRGERERPRTPAVCVTRDGKTIITGRGCVNMRGARAAGRERAVVFWMSERVYGGGERSRETERLHTERT